MLPPNTCDNCQTPVQVRRPSASGKHFCQATLCQRAKQAFYRSRRTEDVIATEHDLVRRLVVALAHGVRARCTKCGLADALPGWAHRDQTGLSPCYAMGPLGPGLPSGLLDAIHPERVPGPPAIPPVGSA